MVDTVELVGDTRLGSDSGLSSMLTSKVVLMIH